METATKESERFKGNIRLLRKDDIPYLRPISEFWLRDGNVVADEEVDGDMATCRRSLIPGSGKTMFVAESPDGTVIGMMGLSDEPKDALKPFAQLNNPCEIIVAYVHPDHMMGKGAGTALMNKVLESARTKGKTEILVESGPRHIETGYPFYDKQPGFEKVGKIPNFYGDGQDTQVWRKTL